jgi:hypothetical protein
LPPDPGQLLSGGRGRCARCGGHAAFRGRITFGAAIAGREQGITGAMSLRMAKRAETAKAMVERGMSRRQVAKSATISGLRDNSAEGAEKSSHRWGC